MSDLNVQNVIVSHRPDRQNMARDTAAQAQCLHQMIELQAERTPDNIAVQFEGRVLTYRALNEQANRLAHYLQKRGVGPEVLVAMFAERSIGMIVGLLAVLKTGGAYLPLDPEFPQERLKYMLEDSKPKIVLTDSVLGQRGKRMDEGVESFYLDRDWPLVARESSENPHSTVRPRNLAYVIYTSGSTGKPKGVELTHFSVVNFMRSMQAEPGISEADTLLAVTTISFDIAALELFLPLTVGARIVLATRQGAKIPQSLAKYMAEHNVTIMQAAPTSWRLLVESGWKGESNLKVLCGGEALTRELADELLARVPELWNMYGPTETTIWSTIERVNPGNGSVPIGRPIANTQVYVLDTELKPVPNGEIGELFIGGDGLARGYLNRPETTAERFISNPIPGEPSSRLYRTGDLARILPSGVIEYQGRVDHQIKIHGVRVEPGEIESAILQYPEIKQALVVAREDRPGDKQLIAYVIPTKLDGFVPGAIRNFLKDKLPAYLIPSAFVPLTEFPLTFNGKVDRKALPEPPMPTGTRVAVAEGPRDELEYRLVTIWEEILRVKPVGLRDNFFDLGGHSLMAARLLARIDQSLGKELPLESLLDAPTIDEQAQLIRGYNKNGSQPVASPTNSSVIPLFYLGGDPTFQALSQRLRSLHEFHSLGIQASIVRQLKNRYALECIAEHFVHAIKARRPHGPYMLGGWCAHGLLALETAQQLRRQGEEVALVVMLETVNPVRLNQQGYFTRLITRMQLKLNLLEFEYAYMRTLGREQARDYVMGRFVRKMGALRRDAGQKFRGTSQNQMELDQKNLLEVLYGAASNYIPMRYDSPVMLVHSRKPLFGFANDPHLGWDKSLTSQLELCEVAGNHYTMYTEPNVEGLAQLMNSRLKAAERRLQSGKESAAALSS